MVSTLAPFLVASSVCRVAELEEVINLDCMLSRPGPQSSTSSIPSTNWLAHNHFDHHGHLQRVVKFHATEENSIQKSSEKIVDSIFHQVVLVDEQSLEIEPNPRLLVFTLITGVTLRSSFVLPFSLK